MSRSRAAWRLAGQLAAGAKVPVEVMWQGASRGWAGGWHVAWADGPKLDQMCALVSSASLPGAPEIRSYDRGSSDLGEAAALLAHLAERPSRARYVSGCLVQEAHSRTAHPDRGDVVLLGRARALLAAHGGTCGADALSAIRERAQSGGMPAVLRWLDELAAAAADPAVPSLADARARRAARVVDARPGVGR